VLAFMIKEKSKPAGDPAGDPVLASQLHDGVCGLWRRRARQDARRIES
jgi:hypothetical protein